MPKRKICPICKRSFLASKYRKDQKVCSRPGCQHRRQLENMATWREKNPGYFKTSRHETSWAQLYRQRARSWRKKHKGKIRRYRKAHKEEQKEYMRMYMYRYRHS
ncbi:MAG: hypothetical protein JW869_06070 [Candidatus Omnitrophica bacterium]|nr:hypothetical protein [Candidatus Omnitrophota bacterium]